MNPELLSEISCALPTVLLADESAARGDNKIGDYTLIDSPDMLQVPDSFNKKIKEIGDTAPLFQTYAVPMGLSRYLGPSSEQADDVPSRYWPEKSLDSMAAKIRAGGMPGYRGHSSSEDMVKLPNPAVLWVAAAKAQDSAGNKALLVRGYIYNIDHNREFVKTGAFNSISPTAMVAQKPVVMDGRTVMMIEQSNPLSLDFVRKSTEGLRGAVILSAEGAQSMDSKLDAATIKLIGEMSVEQLERVAPQAVHSIRSAKGGDQNETVNKLVIALQEQVGEIAKYMGGHAIATQVASSVGCEMSELPKYLNDFANLRQKQIDLAIETGVTAIKNEKTRKLVKDSLVDQKFSTVEDAQRGVAFAVSMVKINAASLGSEMGGIESTDEGTTGSKNPVASTFAATLLGGKR